MASRHDINNFAQKVQALCDAKRLTGGSKIEVNFGRRYARIVHIWGGQTTCWGWVEIATGELHRGGWKAPDTRYGSRGNIADADIMDKIEWTGPRYK